MRTSANLRRSARWRRSSCGGSGSTSGAARRSSGSAAVSSSNDSTTSRRRPSSPGSSASGASGPWSAGVVCLEGLGRYEHGLVGDLGLVKYLRAVRGREVETWETAELLEPYGEWAGLASVYFLAGLARGLVPAPAASAA